MRSAGFTISRLEVFDMYCVGTDISLVLCAESGEKGLTRRKLLHNHHNDVLVLSHQFRHLYLNMGHTQETKVSSTGSRHTSPRNHLGDMPSIPLG